MATYSPFTITPAETQVMVRLQQDLNTDQGRKCYMIQLHLQSVYGGGTIPTSFYKKLPRLINGIPLGAGRLSKTQEEDIRWRYLEGSRDSQTFISVPISLEEAEVARSTLKDALVRLSKAVFGDITVKANIQLSQCVSFDPDFFVNDIAESLQEGLHFHD